MTWCIKDIESRSPYDYYKPDRRWVAAVDRVLSTTRKEEEALVFRDRDFSEGVAALMNGPRGTTWEVRPARKVKP